MKRFKNILLIYLQVIETHIISFFSAHSYGFRPGRSQHDALDALSAAILGKRVNWILDADIEAFFDTIDHLRPILA